MLASVTYGLVFQSVSAEMAGSSSSAPLEKELKKTKEVLEKELKKTKEVLEKKMPDGKINELQKYLKDEFISSIDSFDNHLTECLNMENLGNYANLKSKIEEISRLRGKRFYIGYTEKISDYLWTTQAKSKKWEEAIKEGKLRKVKTYYIHRHDDNEDESDEDEDDSDEDEDENENGEDETEATLISKFGKRARCLNGKHPGSFSKTGIIYVLEYTK